LARAIPDPKNEIGERKDKKTAPAALVSRDFPAKRRKKSLNNLFPLIKGALAHLITIDARILGR
jgi:hypothetical protein